MVPKENLRKINKIAGGCDWQDSTNLITHVIQKQ